MRRAGRCRGRTHDGSDTSNGGSSGSKRLAFDSGCDSTGSHSRDSSDLSNGWGCPKRDRTTTSDCPRGQRLNWRTCRCFFVSFWPNAWQGPQTALSAHNIVFNNYVWYNLNPALNSCLCYVMIWRLRIKQISISSWGLPGVSQMKAV